jgi:hypothetical protein
MQSAGATPAKTDTRTAGLVAHAGTSQHAHN